MVVPPLENFSLKFPSYVLDVVPLRQVPQNLKIFKLFFTTPSELQFFNPSYIVIVSR